MTLRWWVPGAIGSGLALSSAVALAAQDAENGRLVYDRWCVECHGAEGQGDGSAAAWMLPRPRDFAGARYQIRTTGSGQLPTDDDMIEAIRTGLPGTTMPGWPNLSDGEQRDVIAYLKTFSRFFETEDPQPVDLGSDPGAGDDMMEIGRQTYETLECPDCHGEQGRGDGNSAPTLEDWRELPVRAADLTEAWYLNGGASVEGLHTRVLTGLDGTPMPAAAVDAIDAGIVTDDAVWQLAHYLATFGPREMPRLRDVVRVARLDGALPDGPESEAWADIDSFYFPLVGQVIEQPRLMTPAVDGLWVQGVHDGSDLVLRLTWNDPSRSPDPDWDEWQEKIAATMPEDGEPVTLTRLPDALAVQFPLEIPDDMVRPYFLMGDGRSPVYLWQWDSQTGVSDARARGLGQIEPLGTGDLDGAATFTDGQWRLQFRRPLDSGDAPGLAFREGVAIPVGFFAWDGSSAETGARVAISSWYYLFLEQPASRAVIFTPLLAILLTAGLGLAIVRRAQKRPVD